MQYSETKPKQLTLVYTSAPLNWTCARMQFTSSINPIPCVRLRAKMRQLPACVWLSCSFVCKTFHCVFRAVAVSLCYGVRKSEPPNILPFIEYERACPPAISDNCTPACERGTHGLQDVRDNGGIVVFAGCSSRCLVAKIMSSIFPILVSAMACILFVLTGVLDF